MHSTCWSGAVAISRSRSGDEVYRRKSGCGGLDLQRTRILERTVSNSGSFTLLRQRGLESERSCLPVFQIPSLQVPQGIWHKSFSSRMSIAPSLSVRLIARIRASGKRSAGKEFSVGEDREPTGVRRPQYEGTPGGRSTL